MLRYSSFSLLVRKASIARKYFLEYESDSIYATLHGHINIIKVSFIHQGPVVSKAFSLNGG